MSDLLSGYVSQQGRRGLGNRREKVYRGERREMKVKKEGGEMKNQKKGLRHEEKEGKGR